jgi:hypothetical protein
VRWHRSRLAARALADLRDLGESVVLLVPDYESTNRLPMSLLQVPR